MKKATVFDMLESKKVREFIENENLTIESLFMILSKCLSVDKLLYQGFNGANEIYMNNKRVVLVSKRDIGAGAAPQIEIKNLRDENGRLYQIEKTENEKFEAVLVG